MNYNFFDTVAGNNFTQETVPTLVDAIKELTRTQKDTNELLLYLAEELKNCKKEIRDLEIQIENIK